MKPADQIPHRFFIGKIIDNEIVQLDLLKFILCALLRTSVLVRVNMVLK